MKENDAHVDYEPHQLLLYVEKDDGSYGPIQTGAYATKNYLNDYKEKHDKVVSDGINRLKKGEISSINYYLEYYFMTAADLATRASVSLSTVKKHMTPAGFAKAPLELVQRYADVFDIPVINLFQIILPKRNDITITQQKTVNPLLTILELS